MKIYLSKDYSYRKWPILLVGIGIMSSSTFVLFYDVLPSALRTDWTGLRWSDMPWVVLTVAIPSFLLCCGVWIVHAWCTQLVYRLEISDRGIKYGPSGHTWDQIKWLACRFPRGGQPTLFYQTKGFSWDRYLMLTEPLSEDEIEDLFEALEKDVVPLHNELQIG